MHLLREQASVCTFLYCYLDSKAQSIAEGSTALSLESARWSELQHAYGSAGDIPALLGQLQTVPSSMDGSEPWFTLWSALAHQGNVYSASFAAVPHVVDALARALDMVDHDYFQFPAWVEICRVKSQAEIPEDLRAAYLQSLDQFPSLVAAASSRAWDPDFLPAL